MQNIDPNKQYIVAGLEVDEAQMLVNIIARALTFHDGLEEDEIEFATTFHADLQEQIEHDLTISGGHASGISGVMNTEPVGEASVMPGTDGFTVAVFNAADVPVGTKLYTHPFLEPVGDE